MLLLALSLVVVGLLYFLYKFFFKSLKGLPPLFGPGIIDNVKTLSRVNDLSAIDHLHRMSLQVISRGGEGKTSNGALFRISMPQMSPFIINTDYKLALKVLQGDSQENLPEADKSPILRAFDYSSTPSLLSHLTSSKERYRNRKHIAVSFSSKNLEYTHEVMKKCLERFGNILEKHEVDKSPIVLDSAMVRLTLDIITEAAFGLNFNTMFPSDDNMGEFYMHENELFLKEAGRAALNPVRGLMFWDAERKRAMEAKSNVMKLAQGMIDNYRKHISEKGISIDDDKSIMGRLISCEYDNDKKRAQDILIMLLGGHETSSHSVSYLILGMIRHPHVKIKLQAELDACISAEARHDHSKLNFNEIAALPYLSQCIKESMRLWSVIGGGIIRVLTHDIHYEGYFLPRGSSVRSAVHSISRQPWIEKPDEFIPERWSDSNPQHAQLKEMFLPFGTGKRQCIGQNMAKVEVAMIAAYVLRFFDFKLLSEPVEQMFLTRKAVGISVEVQLRT